MMIVLSTFATGLIFGLGLVISGMSNPAKVLNFLDIFGTWDPSLAFVMGGAVIVTMPGFRLLGQKLKPVFANAFYWPRAVRLDSRLITGAAIFGIGWGLGGFCPGPALTAIPMLASGTLIFVPMMVTGMWLAKLTTNRDSQSATTPV
jgi:uncharacterized membrane protein YedE/YeeE